MFSVAWSSSPRDLIHVKRFFRRRILNSNVEKSIKNKCLCTFNKKVISSTYVYEVEEAYRSVKLLLIKEKKVYDGKK